MVGPVAILFVQDQPEFKTRIGAANLDAGFLAIRYRFPEPRMGVAVKHNSDLVALLKRIPSTAAASVALAPLGVLGRLYRDCVPDTHTWVGMHCNQRA